MCTSLSLYIYIYIYICTCIYIGVYIYIHTYIHIHIHIRIQDPYHYYYFYYQYYYHCSFGFLVQQRLDHCHAPMYACRQKGDMQTLQANIPLCPQMSPDKTVDEPRQTKGKNISRLIKQCKLNKQHKQLIHKPNTCRRVSPDLRADRIPLLPSASCCRRLTSILLLLLLVLL